MKWKKKNIKYVSKYILANASCILIAEQSIYNLDLSVTFMPMALENYCTH